MKKWKLLPTCIILLLVALTFHLTKIYSQEPFLRKIVVFKQPLSNSEKESLIKKYRGVWLKELRLINAASINIPESLSEALSKEKEIVRIDPDLEVFALDDPPAPALGYYEKIRQQNICDWLPNWSGCGPSVKPTPTPTPTPTPAGQTNINNQSLPWGIVKIHADDSWSVSSGSGVKVAVIDTGMDTDHPDLKDNLAGCLNFIQTWKTCEDDNGHGTHVAGIIASVNNNLGVVGVAPQAKIYALKVLDRRGNGYLSDIIEALQWAIDNHIQVVNMSLGLSSDVVSFHEAISEVKKHGIVQIAAAGNSGPAPDSVSYPARYGETIAVSALDINNNVPSWSSRGSQIDLAAPGVNIYSTYLYGRYKSISGTSMAAPHVAGVAALRLYLKSDETPDALEALLKEKSDPLPFDSTLIGAGIVNAQKVTSAP